MLVPIICSHPCKTQFPRDIVSTITELVNAWLTYFTGLYFVVKGEERRKAYLYYPALTVANSTCPNLSSATANLPIW